MANYTNIDKKSPAGMAGFCFGTRGNKLVYVHCGKPARIIQQVVMPLYPTPSKDDKCKEFVGCVVCSAEARIKSQCDRGGPHSHFGFAIVKV